MAPGSVIWKPFHLRGMHGSMQRMGLGVGKDAHTTSEPFRPDN